MKNNTLKVNNSFHILNISFISIVTSQLNSWVKHASFVSADLLLPATSSIFRCETYIF